MLIAVGSVLVVLAMMLLGLCTGEFGLFVFCSLCSKSVVKRRDMYRSVTVWCRENRQDESLIHVCIASGRVLYILYGPMISYIGQSCFYIMASFTRCCSITDISPEYWHFILDFSIIGGIGSSLLFTPAVATISHWFSRRRSTATGLATTGGSIGGVIFPLALQSLIPKVGFAWATRIVGFIFVFFVIFANLLVKGRLAPKNKTRVNDVLPDFRIFLDGTGAFALVTAGTFFMEFGLFVPITYLTSYCIANGVDPTFSYQVIAILNAGSCFGRWLPGLAADRMGRFNIMILTLMLCLITTFAFWLPATYDAVVPLIVVYSVLFGFASGSNISLVPTCVGQLCDTREYGRYYATCYTVVSFSTLTGIPIAGALIDAAGGSYWGVIVFTGLCYVASVMCFVAVRVRKVGWSLRARW